MLFKRSTGEYLPLLFFILFSVSQTLFAQAPQLACRSAVLYDVTSGALLFEKNSDEVIPPASMTKLMTLHLIFNAVDGGRLSLDQVITVSRNASFKAAPNRSSLMFLEEGQRLTVLELMKGLAVSSGNDASSAAAEAVAGSVPAFVAQMNSEAKKLGLEKTSFADASGYSSENRTTASEFARFCLYYIEKHPASLSMLHSLEEFTYPEKRHIPPGERSTHGSLTQKNNNVMLGKLEGVDGLKTGFTDESGYNIALTAEREGRRLLAVVMGVPEERGILTRAIDSTTLISYGFYYYKTFYPQLPALPSAKIYRGKERRAELTASVPAVTLPRDDAGSTVWEIKWGPPLAAPFKEGTTAARITLCDKTGAALFTSDVVTKTGAEKGSFGRRVLDSILLFFAGLFR